MSISLTNKLLVDINSFKYFVSIIVFLQDQRPEKPQIEIVSFHSLEKNRDISGAKPQTPHYFHDRCADSRKPYVQIVLSRPSTILSQKYIQFLAKNSIKDTVFTILKIIQHSSKQIFCNLQRKGFSFIKYQLGTRPSLRITFKITHQMEIILLSLY